MFQVSVADEGSGVRSVKFQLRDPGGTAGSFVTGNVLGTGGATEWWRSPEMPLDGPSGVWQWRAQAMDNNKNKGTSDWKDVVVLVGESAAAGAIQIIRADIGALIAGNEALPAKFLTLRVSPPAHPETTPRRVEVIWEVREHRWGLGGEGR